MNSTFSQLIASRIQAAIASASAVAGIGHAGMRGSLREAFVRDLLRPVMPPRLGFAHGLIASAYEQQSTEQDVVIFDTDALPTVLLDGESGLIPIEAALYSIEVKSSLSEKNLRETHEKAEKLNELMHLPCPDGANPEHVIPCLFAWGSNLLSPPSKELERYKEIISDQSKPPLRSICVVGHGYWYFSSEWFEVKADADYSEVKAFIAGIFDTYARVASTRVRVGLGKYLRN